jgi:pyridoxine 5-phosphate synthase
VRVSLFMDPIPEQMAAAKAVGADRVELYTEPFAANWGKPSRSSNCKPMPGPRRPRWMPAWASMPAMTSIATTWPPLWPGCRVWPKSPSATLIADALELGYAETVKAYQACIDAGMAGKNS